MVLIAPDFHVQNAVNSRLAEFFSIFGSNGGIGMLALGRLDAATVVPIYLVDTAVLQLSRVFLAGAACPSAATGYGTGTNWHITSVFCPEHGSCGSAARRHAADETSS
jgi:hypothetical protein